ncbi:MAG: alpha/beta hydrolase [Gemmatimonadetes bacterium]|nr:alpha/beta hydrolase [Gemmatimonadota bacterium]
MRTDASLLAALLLGAAACGRDGGQPSPRSLERFTRHVGAVTQVAEQPDPDGTLVTIGTSTGLRFRALVRVPPGPGPFPGSVLADGRELGRHALSYLPPGIDVVVASPDYPDEFPMELDVSTYLRELRAIVRAADRVPASFIALADYLASRPDVDSSRMVLVASSFAVPFASIAAASEPRFKNVALIYGGADLPALLAANLELGPRPLRRIIAAALTWPIRQLEPARYVGGIAPRPLLMVAGLDDPQIPRASIDALYDAAREPKDIVWMRTGHLMPWHADLIRQLVDTAFQRLPILREQDVGRERGRPALRALRAPMPDSGSNRERAAGAPSR